MITVVMYHYVREIKNSRYPGIKGLEAGLFKKQLSYLKQYYSFITMEELIASFEESYELPENAVLLTFDDGYLDHFKVVFPVLDQMKIEGSFFVPVKPVMESRVLDVNKIHFMLATVPIDKLLSRTEDMLGGMKNEPGILTYKEYYRELANPNRFDPAEVIFIKRLLQHKLPDPYRSEIVDHLFETCFHVSEEVLAKELYLSLDQCRSMLKNGMHIGAHTYDHYWLDKIDESEQQRQFKLNLEFLEDLGAGKRTMAYPFGGYNSTTLTLMHRYDFSAGFTTRVDTITDSGRISKYELPRVDTNDIPKGAASIAPTSQQIK